MRSATDVQQATAAQDNEESVPGRCGRILHSTVALIGAVACAWVASGRSEPFEGVTDNIVVATPARSVATEISRGLGIDAIMHQVHFAFRS